MSDPKPIVVCLCGSTRFSQAFRDANLRETLAGHIVLSIGCDLRSDNELWADPLERARLKAMLDELHLRKIDLADEILVLNQGGYIGESTSREIEYARQRGKTIRYLENKLSGRFLAYVPEAGQAYEWPNGHVTLEVGSFPGRAFGSICSFSRGEWERVLKVMKAVANEDSHNII